MMLSRNTIITIATKSSILLLNFALVVFTTHLWGSAGRGEIALVIANISIINLLSNIFCGSTISFHAPRFGLNFLMIVSFSGALLISLSGAAVFSIILEYRYFIYLFFISLFLSLTSSISSYWLGRSNFMTYNLLTLLLPLLILVPLTMIYFIFHKTSLNTYFNAYLAGSGLLLIIGIITLSNTRPFNFHDINISGIRSIIIYGGKNEINSLIQFITYRLSYFFIAKYLGLIQLGIFSVAVAISEAFWVISRSMSAIHYSNVLNSKDNLKSRKETKLLVKQSFFITMVLLCVSMLIPESIYRFIFGKEFGEIKSFIFYIIPGIISVAVSNIYDQYFSGTGDLLAIRYRSLIGLGLITILMPLLINKYQLTGICISINVSYILSAIYIWIKFKNETKLDEISIS